MTIAAAKSYAEKGFDGIVHLKSSGCTPEIDVMPVLQRISKNIEVITDHSLDIRRYYRKESY